jgi:tRNA nucleotidyltransferase (CCA-adding enzyme)
MLPSNRDTVKPTSRPEPAPPDLLAGLPPALAAALGRAVELAAAREARLWLVGGVVRDLFGGVSLGRDVDLAVEGDAVSLATALAPALGGRLVASHPAFGTATVAFPAPALSPRDLVFDLAGAREEEYPRPAALPVVRSVDIASDLRRRDFSINAIAVELRLEGGRPRPGVLLDPFAGRADLAASRLRLLHQASLRDDPTRLLRGLRLAARLGLTPDEATAAQIADALGRGYLAMLTPARVLAELCLALDEPRPDQVLALADAWGVTAQLVPGLVWSAEAAARLASLREGGATSGLVMAGLLCYQLAPRGLAEIARRYPLPASFGRLFGELPAAREAAQRLGPDLCPSQVDDALRPFSAATIDVLHYAEPGPAGQIVGRYLREIRPARPPLDGRDLQRIGVAPGPEIGRALDALRAAYLDGAVSTAEQAETWVRQRLAENLFRSGRA